MCQIERGKFANILHSALTLSPTRLGISFRYFRHFEILVYMNLFMILLMILGICTYKIYCTPIELRYSLNCYNKPSDIFEFPRDKPFQNVVQPN